MLVEVPVPVYSKLLDLQYIFSLSCFSQSILLPNKLLSLSFPSFFTHSLYTIFGTSFKSRKTSSSTNSLFQTTFYSIHEYITPTATMQFPTSTPFLFLTTLLTRITAAPAATPCLCAQNMTGNFCNTRSVPGGNLTGSCSDDTLYTCNGTAVPVLSSPCTQAGSSFNLPCVQRESEGDVCAVVRDF